MPGSTGAPRRLKAASLTTMPFMIRGSRCSPITVSLVVRPDWDTAVRVEPIVRPWALAYCSSTMAWPAPSRPSSASLPPLIQAKCQTAAKGLGSMALTPVTTPFTLRVAKAMPVAVFVSGSARTAATPLAGSAIMPVSSVTTTAARFEFARASTNDVFSPWANTATKTTSARPIISAAAVAAVRCGLRAAFSRARRPLVGASACSGRPMSAASGRTTYLASMAIATNSATAPAAISSSRVVVAAELTMPATRAPAPSRAMTQAIGVLRRPRREGGSCAPSESAATGGTLVARSAGSRADARVTPTPTSSATTIVRGLRARPPVGRSAPTALKSASMALATPSPATRPSSDAARPIVRASPVTVASTWRRDAPRARSMANSRRRWATVIEKALKMMKAPTNTATPPKASSAGCRNELIELEASLLWLAAACAPVLTSTVAGSAARSLSRS